MASPDNIAANLQYPFKGKRILVTGAGKGIGKGIAIKLATLGASVFGLGRTAEHLEELRRECPSIDTVQVDLSDWEGTKRAVESILPIDMLVNNAAIYIPQAFLDSTEDAFDKTMHVNLKAVINVSQVVAKSMIERKVPGSIVNVSSRCARLAIPDKTFLCASKAGLDALTRSMALELGPYNIRVNGINPTVIVTNRPMVGDDSGSKRKTLLARTPLHRLGEIEDCANAVVFLLSDQSKFITGAHLPLDGGLLAT